MLIIMYNCKKMVGGNMEKYYFLILSIALAVQYYRHIRLKKEVNQLKLDILMLYNKIDVYDNEKEIDNIYNEIKLKDEVIDMQYKQIMKKDGK